MSIVTIPGLRRRFGGEIDRMLPLEKRASPLDRRAAGRRIIIGEARARTDVGSAEELEETYDIFLSHRYADGELIVYVKRFLQSYGYKVYVDWDDDPQFSRDDVSAATAHTLRERLKGCTALLAAITVNAMPSQWIPWEIGYADGAGKRVAVLPLLEADGWMDSYEGAEYLGLYPYVHEGQSTDRQMMLWTSVDTNTYVPFGPWIYGVDPFYHERS